MAEPASAPTSASAHRTPLEGALQVRERRWPGQCGRTAVLPCHGAHALARRRSVSRANRLRRSPQRRGRSFAASLSLSLSLTLTQILSVSTDGTGFKLHEKALQAVLRQVGAAGSAGVSLGVEVACEGAGAL